jgi:hypothetical protein
LFTSSVSISSEEVAVAIVKPDSTVTSSDEAPQFPESSVPKILEP